MMFKLSELRIGDSAHVPLISFYSIKKKYRVFRENHNSAQYFFHNFFIQLT